MNTLPLSKGKIKDTEVKSPPSDKSTLEKLPEEHVDMQSTVIIGKSTTFVADGKMITPRGYKA